MTDCYGECLAISCIINSTDYDGSVPEADLRQPSGSRYEDIDVVDNLKKKAMWCLMN